MNNLSDEIVIFFHSCEIYFIILFLIFHSVTQETATKSRNKTGMLMRAALEKLF